MQSFVFSPLAFVKATLTDLLECASPLSWSVMPSAVNVKEFVTRQSLSSSMALKAELSTDLKGQTRLWNDADPQQTTQQTPSLPFPRIN